MKLVSARYLVLASVLAVSSWDANAVRLFISDPGSPEAGQPDFEPVAFTTEVEYPIEINLRPVADAAETIEVSLPSGNVITFAQRRFSPLFGYIVTDDLDVRLDPKVPDDRIRFNWYGVAAGAELSMAVHDGVTSARITAGTDVYTVTLGEAGTVLRLHDMDEFPEEIAYPDHGMQEPNKIRLGATPKYVDAVSILVVNTANAVAAAGSQAAFDSNVATSIADLQVALLNSGIVQTSIHHIMPGGATSALV